MNRFLIGSVCNSTPKEIRAIIFRHALKRKGREGGLLCQEVRPTPPHCSWTASKRRHRFVHIWDVSDVLHIRVSRYFTPVVFVVCADGCCRGCTTRNRYEKIVYPCTAYMHLRHAPVVRCAVARWIVQCTSRGITCLYLLA